MFFNLTYTSLNFSHLEIMFHWYAKASSSVITTASFGIYSLVALDKAIPFRLFGKLEIKNLLEWCADGWLWNRKNKRIDKYGESKQKEIGFQRLKKAKMVENRWPFTSIRSVLLRFLQKISCNFFAKNREFSWYNMQINYSFVKLQKCNN